MADDTPEISLVVETVSSITYDAEGRPRVVKSAPVKLGGWTSVAIDRSIARAADSFAFQYYDIWYPEDKQVVLEPDLICHVDIDGELAIVGWSVATSIKIAGEDTYILNCEGYSLPGLTYKSSAISKTGQFKNASFKNIVKELTKNYNFGVDFDSSLNGEENETIRSFCIDEGEFTINALERLCRMFGALMTARSNGRLKIWRTDESKPADYIFDVKPLEFTHVKDFADRCSEYLIVGERPSNATNNGKGSSGANIVSIVDSNVLTYSPVIVSAEGPGYPKYLDRRAQYEVNVRAGRSEYVMVKFPGCRDVQGKFIEPGGTVDFSYVPSASVSKRPIVATQRMMVESVSTTLDKDNGLESVITLVDPKTYSVTPQPPEIKKSK